MLVISELIAELKTDDSFICSNRRTKGNVFT